VVAVAPRFLKQQKIKHMDTLSIIAAIAAFAAVGGLAWLGGYEIGQANGITTERQSANRRINGVLDSINTRKPKAAKNKRKAARKAVRP
jgi:hypothetical protein